MHTLLPPACVQRDYVLGLRTLLRRGGSLYAGVFSDANPDPWSNPRRMSEAQLRELFCAANGWRAPLAQPTLDGYVADLSPKHRARAPRRRTSGALSLMRGTFLRRRCVASIESCWYARPSERSDSSGGAWTMAWWCKAEAV